MFTSDSKAVLHCRAEIIGLWADRMGEK